MTVRSFCIIIAAMASLGASTDCNAQWGQWWGPSIGPGWGQGWRPLWVSRGQPSLLGKVSVTGDYNYDGFIDGRDIGMERGLKEGPLGLVIGTDEMTKIKLTCVPTPKPDIKIGDPKIDLKYYKLTVILSVQGINLNDRKGRWNSLEEEFDYCGRILVWSDETRSELLLDSSDVTKRTLMWPYSESVPLPHVYVEGVNASHPGAAHFITWELDDTHGRNGFQRAFGEPAVWDRIMVTVTPDGIEKPLVDRSPVWLKFAGSQMGHYTSSK